MGMVVRSNIMAINANRQLGMNNSQVSKSLEKLSSGYRINRAGDDASGLAISEKMKAQIKGLETASANSQDGISLIQTAEGALTEVHDMLNRMVELCGKAANGTMDDVVDRPALQEEVDALRSEIDRIAKGTNFNGIKLLDGSLGGGSSAIADISYKNITSAALSNSAPSASNFTSGALTGIANGAVNGDKITFSVVLEGGKTHTVELVVGNAKDGTANKGLYTADGTFIADLTTAGEVTAKEAADAVVGELTKVIGDGFTVENSNNTIKLTASENGSSTTKVLGFSEDNKGTPAAQKVTTVLGTDKFKKFDISKQTVFNGSNADSAVFTINGKKFALVANTATAEDIAKLGSDVNYLKLAGATGAAGDVANLVALINQKAGTNLAAPGTGTVIDLKNAGSVSIAGNGGLTLQIGDTADDYNKMTVSIGDMSSAALGISGIDISTIDGASEALALLRDSSGGGAINMVSSTRADLGALQNRLEHTINNLDVASENMQSANSRIRDTDMAKQMMEYTKQNVLTQAAQAMLAQANQQPQSILQLLQ